MKKLSVTIIVLFFGSNLFAQGGSVDWYKNGKKYQADKNYKLAVVAFKKAVEANSSDFESWYELGWCQIELKEYDNAILSLIKADQVKPGYAKVFFELGYAHEKKTTYADAIYYYRKCVSSNSTYASAWYNKGWCENQTGLYDSAYVSCTNAARYKTNYKEAYDELGYACFKLKRSAEALDAYRKSLVIDSNSRTAYLGLGDIYKSNYKNTDSALFYFNKAYIKSPEHPKAPYSIGWCYNEKEMYNEAIPWLKKCLEVDANYKVAKVEMGYAYYKLKNYDDALTQFSQVISSYPKDELSRYYAGFCYYLKNDQSNLKRMIDQLQTINTSSSLQYVETLKKYIK